MFQNGQFLAACLMAAGLHHVGTTLKLTMEFMKVSPIIQAAQIGTGLVGHNDKYTKFCQINAQNRKIVRSTKTGIFAFGTKTIKTKVLNS